MASSFSAVDPRFLSSPSPPDLILGLRRQPTGRSMYINPAPACLSRKYIPNIKSGGSGEAPGDFPDSCSKWCRIFSVHRISTPVCIRCHTYFLFVAAWAAGIDWVGLGDGGSQGCAREGEGETESKRGSVTTPRLQRVRGSV